MVSSSHVFRLKLHMHFTSPQCILYVPPIPSFIMSLFGNEYKLRHFPYANFSIFYYFLFLSSNIHNTLRLCPFLRVTKFHTNIKHAKYKLCIFLYEVEKTPKSRQFMQTLVFFSFCGWKNINQRSGKNSLPTTSKKPKIACKTYWEVQCTNSLLTTCPSTASYSCSLPLKSYSFLSLLTYEMSSDLCQYLQDLIHRVIHSHKCPMNINLILNSYADKGIWNVACTCRHIHR
jgi:hypothetical protein